MPERDLDWIDVTVPVRDGMVVWPGDRKCSITRAMRLEDGDPCNLTTLELSAHTGTHMDAPRHFLSGGLAVDQMPVDAAVGPCRVVALEAENQITPEHLKGLDLMRGERVLFKTPNTPQSWKMGRFDKNFVAFNAPAAKVLAEAKIRLVGIDYLSIGGFEADGDDVHRIVLGAGIWVVEGLDLSGVEPGRYDLVCLPLKVVGADGAPARVILRPRS